MKHKHKNHARLQFSNLTGSAFMPPGCFLFNHEEAGNSSTRHLPADWQGNIMASTKRQHFKLHVTSGQTTAVFINDEAAALA